MIGIKCISTVKIKRKMLNTFCSHPQKWNINAKSLFYEKCNFYYSYTTINDMLEVHKKRRIFQNLKSFGSKNILIVMKLLSNIFIFSYREDAKESKWKLDNLIRNCFCRLFILYHIQFSGIVPYKRNFRLVVSNIFFGNFE